MNYFFKSWKDALSLFLPRTAWPFIQVTLKSIISFYRIFFRNFWWLFGFSSLLNILVTRYFPHNIPLQMLLYGAWLVTIFAMYLTIRPSNKRKSFDYYTDYGIHFLYFIAFSAIGAAIPIIIINVVYRLASCASAIHSLCYIFALPLVLLPALISLLVATNHLPLYISPLLTFVILFHLDSRSGLLNGIKAMIRSFKMVVYNYPFCVIVFTFFTLCSLAAHYLLTAAWGMQSNPILSIASYLILPIPLCVLTNFYTKRMHEQFSLYYPETVKD